MTGSPADAEDAVAVDNKRIRKLDRREHDRTRELYEVVFPEDSQLFEIIIMTRWQMKMRFMW